jgi:hypothetical protein
MASRVKESYRELRLMSSDLMLSLQIHFTFTMSEPEESLREIARSINAAADLLVRRMIAAQPKQK